MFNALVSIITPTFNSLGYIEKTIHSILNQTYTNWELLITDDCSKDRTWDIIKDYSKKDNRIKAFQLKENSGPGVARNNSILNASGHFIAFCDSDDIWEPNKLEIQLQYMKSEDCHFCHTSYALYNSEGINLNKRTVCKKLIQYSDLIKYNLIGTSTVIFNAQIIGKPIMPNIRNRQDWALWLQIIKKVNKACFINKPLVKYTINKNSISHKKMKLIRYHWLIYKEIEGFNFITSVFYLLRNLVFHTLHRKIKSYKI